MSRTQSSPRLTDLKSLISPRFVVLGLAVAAAGCSGGVTRFDSPFGLTETGSRPPIPRESMRGSSSSLADSSPYDGGGYAQPSASYAPVNVAALPDNTSGGYQSQPYQSPAYQPSYRQSQPSYQPSYQPPAQSAPSYTPPNSSRSYEPAPQAVRSERSYRPEPSTPEPSYASQPRQPRTVGPGNTIEIQQGDTLYGIAQEYRASISELMALNGLSSPVLRPGQTLMLPGKQSSTAVAVRGSSRPTRETRVAALHTQETPTPLPQPGSYAAETAPAAAPANVMPLNAAASAPPAQADEPADGAPGTHTLKRGESLYGIAVKYRVPLAELQSINNITDPRKLRPGIVLRLPGDAGEPKQAIASAAPATEERPAERLVEKVSAPSQQVQPNMAALQQGASGIPSKLVIINAQTKQVAALHQPGETATDAAPAAQPAEASAPSPADTTSKFRWPVRGKIISSFGTHSDGSKSDGIKLAVPVGTEVHAAEGGVVAYAGDELKGYGNLVLLRHDNGWITAYAHNDQLSVKRGDRVRRGQVIAKAGKSGNADTPQLHFELRQGSSPVDPIPHLEKL